jgi:hypothetical protein
MTMLSQGFAVLVAAALLSWRARVRGSASSIRSTAVVVVVAVLTFVSLSSLWDTWQGFRDNRRANAVLAPANAATLGGAAAGANLDFVEWLSSNLPPRAEFYVSTNGSDPGSYQWLTYRLFPHVAIPDRAKAHWIVFLRVTVEAGGFKRGEFSRVLAYGPDLLLAERRP